jgi:hypothetical protein
MASGHLIQRNNNLNKMVIFVPFQSWAHSWIISACLHHWAELLYKVFSIEIPAFWNLPPCWRRWWFLVMHNLRARSVTVPLATFWLTPFCKLKLMIVVMELFNCDLGQSNLPMLFKSELNLFNHKLKTYFSFQIRNIIQYISAGNKVVLTWPTSIDFIRKDGTFPDILCFNISL